MLLFNFISIYYMKLNFILNSINFYYFILVDMIQNKNSNAQIK